MKAITDIYGACKKLGRKYRTQGIFGVFLAAIRKAFGLKELAVYYIYSVKMEELEPKHPGFSEMRTAVYYGMVNVELVDKLAAINDKRATFHDRLENGAFVVVAEWLGIPVGYLWGDASNVHLEERHGFEIPVGSDEVYFFDSYILPDFRGRAIFSAMLKKLADYSHMRVGRSRIIAIIDKNNINSIRVHEALGFKVKSLNIFLKIFGSNVNKEIISYDE